MFKTYLGDQDMQRRFGARPDTRFTVDHRSMSDLRVTQPAVEHPDLYFANTEEIVRGGQIAASETSFDLAPTTRWLIGID